MPRPTFVAAAATADFTTAPLAFDPGTSDFIVFGAGRGTLPTWRGSGAGLTIRQTEPAPAFFDNAASLITTETPGSGSGNFTLTNAEMLSALSLLGVTGVAGVSFADEVDISNTSISVPVSCGADQLIVFWAVVNGTPAAVTGSANTTVRATGGQGVNDRTFVIGTSTGNIDLGGWSSAARSKHVQWVVLNGIPGTTQVLRPDATVENTDWTPNTGTAHGDTSDESDTSFIEATADAASVTLALANPSPPFESLSGAVLTVRARIAP